MNLTQKLAHYKICLLLPSYNNAGTLGQVIESLQAYTSAIIVVNDGSTDGTLRVLERYRDQIIVITYPMNRGKGYALKQGFRKASMLGYDYALSIDTDGQHKAESVVAFLEELEQCPGALIVGSRLLKQKNMPGKNTFANQFSNFWFRVQTGIDFPDTQSGYRLYPLHAIQRIKLWTNRYETELELLVRSAWNGIPLRAVPIDVYYPPLEERVSHFRPFWDFARISALNTVFVWGAVLYGYPKMGYRAFVRKRR